MTRVWVGYIPTCRAGLAGLNYKRSRGKTPCDKAHPILLIYSLIHFHHYNSQIIIQCAWFSCVNVCLFVCFLIIFSVFSRSWVVRSLFTRHLHISTHIIETKSKWSAYTDQDHSHQQTVPSKWTCYYKHTSLYSGHFGIKQGWGLSEEIAPTNTPTLLTWIRVRPATQALIPK